MAKNNLNRELVFDKYNGCCAYCGIKLDFKTFHVDHIVPKRRGTTREYLERKGIAIGFDRNFNYNPACISCNCSKNTFSIDEWREQIELKADKLRRDSSAFRLLEKYGVLKQVKSSVTFYFETL